MSLERIAGACFWIALTSAAAAAQQTGAAANTQPLPATSVTERTYPNGGFMSSRRVQKRSESAGHETVIETIQFRGVEGNWEPVLEMVTETTRGGNTAAPARRDVFVFGLQRERRLLETTQSDEQTLSNAHRRLVQDTRVPDVNGRLALMSRRIEERTLVVPGTYHSDATLLLRGPDVESLRETERTESTERQVSPTVVRHDSTRLLHDPNGRWLPVEAQSAEARNLGPSERVEEQTIQRLDVNGKLAVAEKIVTRRSDSNGEDRAVIETYSQDAEGFALPDSRLALSRRVRSSTTTTADGGHVTVEEVEARNPVALSEPMRVIRRTVTTVRRVGSDRWVTQRQMFERDVNGRLVLVMNETEEATER